MIRFACPYLGAEVELTDERERHIHDRHPDLLKGHQQRIAQVLADPDEVRTDARYPTTRLFSRWFGSGKTDKIMVVVVVTDPPIRDASLSQRHWVVTAYLTRRLTQGVIEWTRP